VDSGSSPRRAHPPSSSREGLARPGVYGLRQFGERAYLLREWIEGAIVLDAGCDSRTLDAVELQAGMAPRGRQDWSEYPREVLFDEGWAARRCSATTPLTQLNWLMWPSA
jgi:hypothetical protein